MIRALCTTPLATLLTLLLFYALAIIIRVGNQPDNQSDPALEFDFFIKPQSSPSEPNRATAEPPPPVQKVQQPDIPAPSVQIQMPAPEPVLDIPEITTDVKIAIKPTLPKLKPPRKPRPVRPEPVKTPVQAQPAPVVEAQPAPATENHAASNSVPAPAAPAAPVAFDSSPVVLKRTDPNYPNRARRRNIEGEVIVEFMVSSSGQVKPETLKVIHATPPGVFERSVLRAVKRWRFKPRITNGTPQPFLARQTLEFRLRR